MNIKQIFLPLFGALALIGCNNEALEPTSSNETETQPVRLALTMEATADASEMRAIIFDTSKGIPPTAGNTEAKWTTHCFLHKSGDASKRAYAVIEWDVTNATAGQIKLKMRGSELSLQQSGSQPLVIPQPGERWIITGITGGGKLNADKTRVEFSADGAYDALGANQAQVPFTFEPQGFDVASEGMRAPQISVHFKPQGALLNIYANNKTAQTVQSELKVATNALSNNGYYDFSTGEAKWVFNHAEAQEEVISRPINVANGTGKHYVLWGMPRTESATGFSSKVDLAGYDISVEGEGTKKPEARERGFSNALAYPMGFDIDRVWSPLNTVETTGAPNYVVKVMDATTNSFVDPTSFVGLSEAYASNIYYKYADAVKHFGLNSASNTSNYYLPEIWELGTILPSQKSGSLSSTAYYFNGTLATGAPIIEKVQFAKDEALIEATSQYHGAGGSNTIIYALRFSDLNKVSGNNEKRTAFRYEYAKIKDLTDGTPLYGLKISSRYLGNDGDPIGYNTEEYWTNPSKNTKDIILTVPALGRKNEKFGTGYYWSATIDELNKNRGVNFDNRIIYSYQHYLDSHVFPLILFKK